MWFKSTKCVDDGTKFYTQENKMHVVNDRLKSLDSIAKYENDKQA